LFWFVALIITHDLSVKITYNEAGVCEVGNKKSGKNRMIPYRNGGDKGSTPSALFIYTREQHRLPPHFANTM
jgi:hypothetical protein